MALDPSGASQNMGTLFNTSTYQTTVPPRTGSNIPIGSIPKAASSPPLTVTGNLTGNPMMQGDHTVAGTQTSWHVVVLWFLGAVALLALADPAPQIATGIVIILILGTLLNNWPVYKTYLGLK